MAKTRPLTANLQEVLDAVPTDGTRTTQTAIYDHLGRASGVGSLLAALERRGLIQQGNTEDGQHYWQRVPLSG